MNNGPIRRSRSAGFIFYLGVVATAAMLLFPPFTTLSGREFAFVLTGPEWMRSLDAAGTNIGTIARIDWFALVGQLGVVWLVIGGGLWFLGGSRSAGTRMPTPVCAAVTLSLLLVVPASAQGTESMQDRTSPDAPISLQGGRYGVGFASTWPTYGISGTYQINEIMTAEAIVGAFGTVSNFGGRLWYRFSLDPKYDLYGFGGTSLLRYGYTEFVPPNQMRDATENVLGLSAGAGIESGLQALFGDRSLPPIFFNWEIGLSYADFKHYNFSSFMFGGGVRYRFGTW